MLRLRIIALNHKVPQLDLDCVLASLIEVQENIDEIGKELGAKKEMEDETILYLMKAYQFLNEVLRKDISHLKGQPKKASLFPDIDFSDMVELNNRVLCGVENKVRYEYNESLLLTRNKFYKYINFFRKWHKRHSDGNPWNLAAGVYARVLARPQLFVEGNHRTGSILASLILMRRGLPPLILSMDNAVEYFELSADIKFGTKKAKRAGSYFGRLMGWKTTKSLFKDFLVTAVNDDFLVSK